MSRAAAYDRDTALDAAMTLFWNKGFHATSLKDLELALNMKPGSIYAAFLSKENLYLLALDRYFHNARALFDCPGASDISPLSVLADHLRSYVDLSTEDIRRQACMLTKTVVETGTTNDVIAGQARRFLDELRACFASLFAQAQSRGELPASADPQRLARRFQANVNALRIELHQGIDQAALADLAEDMAQEVEALRP